VVARRTTGLLAACAWDPSRPPSRDLCSLLCVWAPVRRPSRETPCAPLPGLLCKPIGLRHPGGGEANAGTLWAELALTFMRELTKTYRALRPERHMKGATGALTSGFLGRAVGGARRALMPRPSMCAPPTRAEGGVPVGGGPLFVRRPCPA
jgi:hypothetical protein